MTSDKNVIFVCVHVGIVELLSCPVLGKWVCNRCVQELGETVTGSATTDVEGGIGALLEVNTSADNKANTGQFNTAVTSA